LPLDDGCVDAVVCADNALPHLLADDDALTALAEMRRVLRPGATTTRRREATYRAYTRSALTALATEAGLQDVTWHAPDETGFFQPVMVAHAPGISRRTAPRG
jgi:hypothetical protein